MKKVRCLNTAEAVDDVNRAINRSENKYIGLNTAEAVDDVNIIIAI